MIARFLSHSLDWSSLLVVSLPLPYFPFPFPLARETERGNRSFCEFLIVWDDEVLCTPLLWWTHTHDSMFSAIDFHRIRHACSFERFEKIVRGLGNPDRGCYIMIFVFIILVRIWVQSPDFHAYFTPPCPCSLTYKYPISCLIKHIEIDKRGTMWVRKQKDCNWLVFGEKRSKESCVNLRGLWVDRTWKNSKAEYSYKFEVVYQSQVKFMVMFI